MQAPTVNRDPTSRRDAERRVLAAAYRLLLKWGREAQQERAQAAQQADSDAQRAGAGQHGS